MTIETIAAEITDFFSAATLEVSTEEIEYMAEALYENGLTLETATDDQLNNLLRGEDINAWH